MATDFIELNGKKYNALTGKLLPGQDTEKVASAPMKPKVTRRTGTAIDGFTKPVRHKTERSKTLMRHAVKKPAPAPKSPAKAAHHSVQHHPAPRLDIDPKRVERAGKVHKSHLVSRFGDPSSIKPITSAVPVRPEPALANEPPLEHHGVSPLEKKSHTQSFQNALDKATSHTQPHPKKTTRRHRVARKLRVSSKAANITAVSLAIILLGGFFMYQNVPNLSMRIAATRAGVEGSLPGYQPSGFGLVGPIQYERGQITIRYKSHSDNRAFQVNQKSSDWNSSSLLENFVAINNRSYQTYQDNGKTIYIYDGDNATWIDGGIWYQIEGKSSLNSDQLLRLAASM